MSDVSWSQSYSRVGQVLTTTRDNDAYAWSGHYNVQRAYTVNSLDQYAKAGNTPMSWDGRGNISRAEQPVQKGMRHKPQQQCCRHHHLPHCGTAPMTARLLAELDALSHMTPAQLKAEWLRVCKAPPPPLTADLLARGIAWALQERAHGGLAPATLREVARLAKEMAGSESINITAGRIKPGTRLVRDWGRTSHHVTVLERGYLYRDRHYRSLSQIAREITGAHWSGPRFFGLSRKALSHG